MDVCVEVWSRVLCVFQTKRDRIQNHPFSSIAIVNSNFQIVFNFSFFILNSLFCCERPPASNIFNLFTFSVCWVLRYIYFKCVCFCFYSIAENMSEVRACANLFLFLHTWLQARTLRVFWRCRPFTFSQEMHFLKRETNDLFSMDSEVKQKWMDERDKMVHCMSILPVHMLVLAEPPQFWWVHALRYWFTP